MIGKVLVTGATGLVGGALCRRLAKAGTPARALVRSDRDLPIETVQGSLGDEASLQRACAGVKCVIHGAARAGDVGAASLYFEDNVAGTERLLRAAERAGVERFVLMSTISVYGFNPPRLVDEDTPCDAPSTYPYAASKVACERLVRGWPGMDTVIARVGSVYGPRSHHWTVRPVRLMRKSPRGLLLIEGGRGIHNPVYIENLVDALLLAAGHADAPGQTFVLVDESVSYREFFGFYARMQGEERFISLGKARALALASVLEAAARLSRREPLLTRTAVRLLLRESEMSKARAHSVLGWTQAVSLEDGMLETERWLKDEGHL